MKKIYSLFILLTMSCFSLSADPSFLTWTVVGFDHTEWANGQKTLEVTDQANNSYKVNVTIGRYKLATRTQFCTILGTEYDEIPYISLYDSENAQAINANKIEYSSYILFEPVGDFYIKKIEFIGYTHGTGYSNPILGFSQTTSEPTGKDDCPYATENLENEMLPDTFQSLSFLRGTTYPEVCEIHGGWIGKSFLDDDPAFGEDFDTFQKSVKYIRLNWSNARFSTAVPDRGESLDLFGFRIYTTIEDLGTSIENNDADNFSIHKTGESLSFSTPANVKIYSLNGSVSLSANAVEEMSLESLPQGMYIVQAKDILTGKLINEKIIK